MPYGAKGLRPGPKARRLLRTEEIETEENWIGEEIIIIYQYRDNKDEEDIRNI